MKMISTNLRSRVKRLERNRVKASTMGRADRIRIARQRWDSATPQQRAAADCLYIDRCVAELSAPVVRTGEDGPMLSILHRNVARDHLRAMASLKEPDLPEVDQFAREPYWAWSEQKRRREQARKYLADVVLAGDLYTPCSGAKADTAGGKPGPKQRRGG